VVREKASIAYDETQGHFLVSHRIPPIGILPSSCSLQRARTLQSELQPSARAEPVAV